MTLLASLTRRTTTLFSRRWFRIGILLAISVLFIDLWLTIHVYGPSVRSTALPAHHQDVRLGDGNPGLSGSTTEIEPGAGEGAKKEKLFIVSIHWNDAELLTSHWIPALLSFINSYGASNIYISILESGSWDNTKPVLRDLDFALGELGVERSVVLEERSHEDEVGDVPGEGEEREGWIMGRGKKKVMRRIPYLAAARNRAMTPLRKLSQRIGDGRRVYDRVVWLNDVIFTPEQVTTLLATRNGSYTAACALDFSVTHKFYDSFAVRDTLGLPPLTLQWPFFSSTLSRSALTSYLPTPVKSCWNGLVVFDAKPWYLETSVGFRGVEDSLAQRHVEASECCLIHADITSLFSREGGEDKGVWINPKVRVGYNSVAFEAVNREGGWPTAYGKIDGVWANRWGWATGWYWRWRERWVVEGAVRSWAREKEGRREKGEFCLADSMQVLVKNGWVHI